MAEQTNRLVMLHKSSGLSMRYNNYPQKIKLMGAFFSQERIQEKFIVEVSNPTGSTKLLDILEDIMKQRFGISVDTSHLAFARIYRTMDYLQAAKNATPFFSSTGSWWVRKSRALNKMKGLKACDIFSCSVSSTLHRFSTLCDSPYLDLLETNKTLDCVLEDLGETFYVPGTYFLLLKKKKTLSKLAGPDLKLVNSIPSLLSEQALLPEEPQAVVAESPLTSQSQHFYCTPDNLDLMKEISSELSAEGKLLMSRNLRRPLSVHEDLVFESPSPAVKPLDAFEKSFLENIQCKAVVQLELLDLTPPGEPRSKSIGTAFFIQEDGVVRLVTCLHVFKSIFPDPDAFENTVVVNTSTPQHLRLGALRDLLIYPTSQTNPPTNFLDVAILQVPEQVESMDNDVSSFVQFKDLGIEPLPSMQFAHSLSVEPGERVLYMLHAKNKRVEEVQCNVLGSIGFQLALSREGKSTEKGMSGAPLFDRFGNLVAIHRAACTAIKHGNSEHLYSSAIRFDLFLMYEFGYMHDRRVRDFVQMKGPWKDQYDLESMEWRGKTRPSELEEVLVTRFKIEKVEQAPKNPKTMNLF